MKMYFAAARASAALAAFAGLTFPGPISTGLASVNPMFIGSAWAHHSFAMFDQEHPIEIAGTVKEFRYTAPHSIIILEVKADDGIVDLWSLEGGSPSEINRDGWTAGALKPGDAVRLVIAPLRTGAPGGAWNVHRIWFLDGRPIVQKPE
jgi:hypothetical protein